MTVVECEIDPWFVDDFNVRFDYWRRVKRGNGTGQDIFDVLHLDRLDSQIRFQGWFDLNLTIK